MTRFRVSDWIFRFYMGLVFVFMLAPILTLVVYSFNSDRISTWPFKNFTFFWYKDAFQDAALMSALKNSFIVSFAVASIAVIIGFCGAYFLQRYPTRWEDSYLVFAIAPAITPGVILGLGLMVFLIKLGVWGSLPAVIIAHVGFVAVFAMVIIRNGLAEVDPTQEEAAWNLGAPRLRAIWNVVIPQCLPFIIGAFLLTFALSFDEFTLALYTTSAASTLPVQIFGFMTGRISPAINAVGSIVFAITIMLVIIAQILVFVVPARRRRRMLVQRKPSAA